MDRVHRDEHGAHKYVVFVPAGYSPAKSWPIILYLHGACSRGKDGRSQLVSGLAPAVRLRAADYPFLVVFPQCENTQSRLLGGWTDGSPDAVRALRILDAVEQDYSVDRGHEILMGGSMGGCGVWDIASRTPERWSALVVGAASGTKEQAVKVAKIPVWVFHAAGDPFVPVIAAQEMVAAIRAEGGRAFFTELPHGGHDQSGVTSTQQALHDWMLDPLKDPQPIVKWEKPAGYSSGLEEEVPFVPGAEISQAVRFRICHDVLEALAYALPRNLSNHPLQGHVPNVRQSTRIGILPFDVTLSGLHYRGHLEGARLIPQAPDRLLVQLGLRHVTMTVSNSSVKNGTLLFSASAGSMHVVIGHREPVWLNVAVRPRIEQRQLRIDLVGMDFQIPADNWYVTEPSGVRVRGMPFLNRRVSDGLVDGVYSRKSEIERQFLAGIPTAIRRLEGRLNEFFGKTVPIGPISMPIWQPRLRFWPEEIAIDGHGLNLSLGATIAVLGYPSHEFQVRRYVPNSPDRSRPIQSGAEVGFSSQLLPAWTELIIAGGVNRFNALDFNQREFHVLADREFLQQAIPDLKRLGDQWEPNVEFSVSEPISFGDVQGLTESTSVESPRFQDQFTVSVPQLRMAISTRQPGEQRWTPCVEADWRALCDFKLQVQRGGLAARAIRIVRTSELRVEPAARFVPDYEPQDPEIDLERLDSQLTRARQAVMGRIPAFQKVFADLPVAGVPLRLEEFAWIGQRFTIRAAVPPIVVSNDANEPLTYEIRGPFSAWSSPRTLPPGEHDEYRVPYPLIWRHQLPNETLVNTLPLGRESTFRNDPHPGLVLVREEANFPEEISASDANATQ